MELLIWIGAGVLLAVAEVLTVTLVLAMFAIGAFAAALAAGLGAPLSVQLAVFIVVSLLCLAAIRPLLRRHARRAVPESAAQIGVEGLPGSVGTVVAAVDGGAGQVRIGGELWSARAATAGEVIAPGAQVRVTEVDGATVRVARDR